MFADIALKKCDYTLKNPVTVPATGLCVINVWILTY